MTDTDSRIEVRASGILGSRRIIATYPASGAGAVAARNGRTSGYATEVVLVDGIDSGEVDITATLHLADGSESAMMLRHRAE